MLSQKKMEWVYALGQAFTAQKGCAKAWGTA